MESVIVENPFVLAAMFLTDNYLMILDAFRERQPERIIIYTHDGKKHGELLLDGPISVRVPERPYPQWAPSIGDIVELEGDEYDLQTLSVVDSRLVFVPIYSRPPFAKRPIIKVGEIEMEQIEASDGYLLCTDLSDFDGHLCIVDLLVRCEGHLTLETVLI